jgi:hypothetical protein
MCNNLTKVQRAKETGLEKRVKEKVRRMDALSAA